MNRVPATGNDGGGGGDDDDDDDDLIMSDDSDDMEAMFERAANEASKRRSGRTIGTSKNSNVGSSTNRTPAKPLQTCNNVINLMLSEDDEEDTRQRMDQQENNFQLSQSLENTMSTTRKRRRKSKSTIKSFDERISLLENGHASLLHTRQPDFSKSSKGEQRTVNGSDAEFDSDENESLPASSVRGVSEVAHLEPAGSANEQKQKQQQASCRPSTLLNKNRSLSSSIDVVDLSSDDEDREKQRYPRADCVLLQENRVALQKLKAMQQATSTVLDYSNNKSSTAITNSTKCGSLQQIHIVVEATIEQYGLSKSSHVVDLGAPLFSDTDPLRAVENRLLSCLAKDGYIQKGTNKETQYNAVVAFTYENHALSTTTRRIDTAPLSFYRLPPKALLHAVVCITGIAPISKSTSIVTNDDLSVQFGSKRFVQVRNVTSGADKKNIMKLMIREKQPFQYLVDEYRHVQQLSMNLSISLFMDGDKLDLQNDTPMKYGIEDDDLIDLIVAS
jgi:hypothetical protein